MAAMSDYQETTTVDLGALLDAGDGAVVTLVAGETRLAAHRAVLVAGSPVYAAMFAHGTLEASSSEVTIPDVEGPVLRQLLAYLYTRRVPQLPDTAPQLLAAADKYGVAKLKEACEQQVVEQLALENAAAVATLAIRHSCHRLRKAAIAFVKDHTYEVMATQGWAEAVRNQTEDFLELSRMLAERAAETSAPAAEISRPAGAAPVATNPNQLAAPAAAASAQPAVLATAAHRPRTPPPDDADISGLRSLPGEERDKRLIEAAKHGTVPDVKALLAAEADLEAEDSDGKTALLHSAIAGHVDVVRCLLQAGAELAVRSSEWRQTPLHYAAANGRTAVVRLLLESSADVNTRNKNKATPLHAAAQFGFAEVAAVLLKAGAYRGARDNEGCTALDIARNKNYRLVIQTLQ